MKKLLLGATLALVIPLTANAHFLLQYTENTQIERPGDVAMKLIFWHPFENGHVMAMDPPQEFFMVHRGVKVRAIMLVNAIFKSSTIRCIVV